MAYPTPEPAPITALRDRAADDLRFIRAAMDRAGRFTAVPGRGGVLMGLSALVVAAAAPSLTDHTELWLRWWSGELRK